MLKKTLETYVIIENEIETTMQISRTQSYILESYEIIKDQSEYPWVFVRRENHTYPLYLETPNSTIQDVLSNGVWMLTVGSDETRRVLGIFKSLNKILDWLEQEDDEEYFDDAKIREFSFRD